jgi:hypothetical protein
MAATEETLLASSITHYIRGQQYGHRSTPSSAHGASFGASAKTLYFGLAPQRLPADAAYGSGLMAGCLMRRGIEPYVPTTSANSTQRTAAMPAPEA